MTKDSENPSPPANGITRRAAIAGAVGTTLGFLSGRYSQAPKNTSVPAQTNIIPPAVPEHRLTIDSAVKAYQALEKMITEELAKAHEDKQKLKIIFCDNHNDRTSYLAMLMIYDIIKKKNINDIALEGTPGDIEFATKKSGLLRENMPYVNTLKENNPPNFFYFIKDFEKKNIRLVKSSVRGSEEGNKLEKSAKIAQDMGVVFYSDLMDPASWKKRYNVLSLQLNALCDSRDKDVAKAILAQAKDEMIVCGANHAHGIFQNLQQAKEVKSIRTLFVLSHAELVPTPEAEGELQSNGLIQSINYNAFPEELRQQSDLSQIERLKENLRLVTRKEIEALAHQPYKVNATAFLNNSTHKVFDTGLPPHQESLSSATEVFREVKKRLKHMDFVMLPEPRNSDSPALA